MAKKKKDELKVSFNWRKLLWLLIGLVIGTILTTRIT